MAVIVCCRGLSHPTQYRFNFKVRQTSLLSVPNLMGSITLWGYITAFFRAVKPSEDISGFFLMEMKGLKNMSERCCFLTAMSNLQYWGTNTVVFFSLCSKNQSLVFYLSLIYYRRRSFRFDFVNFIITSIRFALFSLIITLHQSIFLQSWKLLW